MAKKKKKHEDHVDESWLLPYSDLMTLLVALYLVLFAMSDVNATKFKQLAESLNQAFSGGTGVFEYPSPIVNEEMKETDPAKGKGKSEQENIEELQQSIHTYIDEKGLKGTLQTTITEEGLKVNILNDILFESGSAEVKKSNYGLTKDLAELLVMDTQRTIIISGHTDNVPISNADYDSNWRLSAERALNFLDLLLENEKLDPRYFSTKGYGEFKAVAPNTTPEGRQKNRRVEILIVPNPQVQTQAQTENVVE